MGMAPYWNVKIQFLWVFKRGFEKVFEVFYFFLIFFFYWQTQENGQLFPYQGEYDALAPILKWFQVHAVSHVFLLASLDDA